MFLPHTINIINSTMASTLRRWRGTTGSNKTVQPGKLPEIYDREGCYRCRLVREAITELNLDVMVYPCPQHGRRFTKRLKQLSGAEQIPFVYDPNTGKKFTGVNMTIDYLFSQYRGIPAPSALQENYLNVITSSLTSSLRGDKGALAKPSKSAKKPLILYSFESSPFCRPVREKLCEYELPYHLINLSKQQLADMGPAVLRLHFGDYKPLPGTKREHFLQKHGELQVPFLMDPNTGAELFESIRIMQYLDNRYGLTEN
jgi:glutaredoxin